MRRFVIELNKQGLIGQGSPITNEWPLFSEGGLTLLRSPLLMKQAGLRHAFTTRLAGRSRQPLDSFNLGRHWHSDQSRKDAMKNRRYLTEVLGLEFESLVVPGQVHSAKVEWAGENEDFAGVDGLITDRFDMPLLLHYADCVPIILYDRKKHILSILHAGWRGTASGIVTNAITRLSDDKGVKAYDLLAAVGPAVCASCYPTSQEVADKLLESVNDREGLVAFYKGKPHPDLRAVNVRQLVESGVRDIDVAYQCTACNPHLFYSHRRFAGKTGRQGAIACLVRQNRTV